MNKLSLTLLGSLVLSSFAGASIIPTLTNVTGSPGNFSFNYNAILSVDQRLDPGATAGTTCAGGALCSPGSLKPASGTFFTIYDIGGFNGVTVTPSANWTAFTQLTGVTPSNVSPIDNNSVTNVSFFYTGPRTPAAGGPQPALLPTNLGTFTIGSIFGSQVVGVYTGQATKNTSDITDGTTTANIGNVPVPAPSVPEPASMLMIGGGFLALASLRKFVSKA